MCTRVYPFFKNPKAYHKDTSSSLFNSTYPSPHVINAEFGEYSANLMEVTGLLETFSVQGYFCWSFLKSVKLTHPSVVPVITKWLLCIWHDVILSLILWPIRYLHFWFPWWLTSSGPRKSLTPMFPQLCPVTKMKGENAWRAVIGVSFFDKSILELLPILWDITFPEEVPMNKLSPFISTAVTLPLPADVEGIRGKNLPPLWVKCIFNTSYDPFWQP